MEKNLSENYAENSYLPPPKNIILERVSPTPMNTPVSECSYMLESFEKICNCRDIKDQKLQDECQQVFNEIKESCFENKN